MFSTSTIASSTNSPKATASPPRVITLIESSIRQKTIAVTMIESGIAVSVMSVVRKFIREQKQHDHHERGAVAQGLDHVGDRVVDKFALTVGRAEPTTSVGQRRLSTRRAPLRSAPSGDGCRRPAAFEW